MDPHWHCHAALLQEEGLVQVDGEEGLDQMEVGEVELVADVVPGSASEDVIGKTELQVGLTFKENLWPKITAAR